MAKALRHKMYQAMGSLGLITAGFPALAATDLDVPEAQTGLPQLDISTYSSQTFWLIIFFLLLYVLMSKLALPRVSEILELRESDINNNLSRAETLQKEMEEVKASYEEALAKAHADAQDVTAKIAAHTSEKVTKKHTAFSEDARKRLIKSEENINQAKNEVLKSMEDIAADITREGLKKVAGITVKQDDALKAVQTQLKEVS